MHEGSLTDDLFEHVLLHAREANARRVLRVVVTIGALSDATAESITFYFNNLAPGTIAENARLDFLSAPGKARCRSCSHEFGIDDRFAVCPQCQALSPEILSGDGVFLTSLDLES